MDVTSDEWLLTLCHTTYGQFVDWVNWAESRITSCAFRKFLALCLGRRFGIRSTYKTDRRSPKTERRDMQTHVATGPALT